VERERRSVGSVRRRDEEGGCMLFEEVRWYMERIFPPFGDVKAHICIGFPAKYGIRTDKLGGRVGS